MIPRNPNLKQNSMALGFSFFINLHITVPILPIKKSNKEKIRVQCNNNVQPEQSIKRPESRAGINKEALIKITNPIDETTYNIRIILGGGLSFFVFNTVQNKTT